ncbi:MAG: bifunctional adenosylcobinamide kinase/adenosylcobinamide-phosphate guanylyltransferase [Lachnospiraceae bacterium]|nr:bifunctional adenosylcobinamide kinase/adenosylcobinamide-phosphate guanylyltransferase [Lachnospiraceae bacterium]
MNVLVTGGAASGKSAYAENLLLSLAGEGERIYIACMRNDSSAAKKRIARHRALREGKGFITLEKPVDLGTLAKEVSGCSILIEGAGMLLSNEMFPAASNRVPEAAGEWESSAGERAFSGIHALMRAAANAVIVTDEVFSDGRVYDSLTASYIRALGALNCRLAALCDRVVEVVYSYPVEISSRGGSS